MSIKTFRRDLSDLIHSLDHTDATASELWTHLPSYTEAEARWGEYAVEHTPSPSEVMHETVMLLTMISHQSEWCVGTAIAYWNEVLDLDPIETPFWTASNFNMWLHKHFGVTLSA